MVPPTRRKGRQCAAARQAAAAAGHQGTLERATSPLLADPHPPTSSPAQQSSPSSPSPATTTVPVTTPSFASVTARPATKFKCDRCIALFKNEGSLTSLTHCYVFFSMWVVSLKVQCFEKV